MRLNFPNPSRSFDESKNRVCFWGYDRSIEVSFFVEADALKLLSSNTCNAEAEFLQAFDTALGRIHKVANEVYLRDGSGSYSYILAAGDF